MPAPLIPSPPDQCSCGHDLLRHTPNCLDCSGAHVYTPPIAHQANPLTTMSGAPSAAYTSRGG